MLRMTMAAGVVVGAALLAGCTTMSKDQCLAGAWGEKGYADGAAGYPISRLDDHAKACAEMPTGLANGVQQVLAQLVGQRLQLGFAQATQFVRRVGTV